MSYVVQSIERPDVLTAVYRFLAEYLKPYNLSAAIIRGWQNRASLPPGTNNYIVYSQLGATRVGTNVQTGIDASGQMTNATLYKASVQIDFCSDSDDCRTWAAYIESILRSDIGTSFFKTFDISSCYSDDLVSVDFVDASEQYVKRSSLTCYLSYYTKSIFSLEYADKVDLERLENVDAHHHNHLVKEG